MLNLCILVLSNTSIYLILTKIPAFLFFFCDGLNEKNILFFYRNVYDGFNVKKLK